MLYNIKDDQQVSHFRTYSDLSSPTADAERDDDGKLSLDQVRGQTPYEDEAVSTRVVAFCRGGFPSRRVLIECVDAL